MGEPDYHELFGAFFDHAADVAGAIALKYFRQDIPVDDKDDRSPVTQADREIEQELRALIGRTFPGHGIIGEEYGSENPDAEFVWVIDPIDGTKSFATGRPLFGTIIGLLHEGVPRVGLIDQAFTRERWFGVADRLATHNGKTIGVAPPRRLEQARLYTGSIAMFEGNIFPNYLTLCRAAKWTHYLCDCYAYGLLAMGWVDLVVEQDLKLFDVAGLIPIVTGAGGFAGGWTLRPVGQEFAGRFVAASSRELAAEALTIMHTTQ